MNFGDDWSHRDHRLLRLISLAACTKTPSTLKVFNRLVLDVVDGVLELGHVLVDAFLSEGVGSGDLFAQETHFTVEFSLGVLEISLDAGLEGGNLIMYSSKGGGLLICDGSLLVETDSFVAFSIDSVDLGR